MTTPDDIPQQLWEKAVNAGLLINPDMLPGEIRTIAHAILSAVEEEREACASWHEHCAEQFETINPEYALWHKDNAAAIRSRKEA